MPLALVAYCGRLLVGGAPKQTAAELGVILEIIPEAERKQMIEDQTRSPYRRPYYPPSGSRTDSQSHHRAVTRLCDRFWKRLVRPG